MKIGLDWLAAADRSPAHVFAKEWDARIQNLLPEERARLYLDYLRLNALRAHPGAWGAGSMDPEIKHIRLVDLRLPETLLGSNFTKQKMVFTDMQVKALLGTAFYVDRRGSNVNQFTLAKKPLFQALGDAITSPDAELASLLRNNCRHDAKVKPLIAKLCPMEARRGSRTYTGSKSEQKMAQARDDLHLALARLPGMWLPAETQNRSGEWAAIQHQLFPYFSEIRAYVSAVRGAAPKGADIGAHLTSLNDLLETAKENLALVTSGKVRAREFADIIAAFPAEEELRTRNIYWTLRFPETERDIIDGHNRFKPDLIAKIETKYLANLEQEIAEVPAAAPKTDLDSLIAALTPEKATSRPTKTWIKKASESLDDAALNDLLDMIAEVGPKIQDDFLSPVGSGADMFTELLNWDMRQQNWSAILWAVHLAGPKAEPVLFDFALQAFRKRPGVGITNEKLGNAATFSISLLDDTLAVASLMRLQRRVAYSSVKKRIGKLLGEVAKRAGLTRSDLEEMSAPDHKLANGPRRIPLKGGVAVLENAGGKVALSWEDDDGRTRKAPPTTLKEKDPDGIKTVRKLAKRIAADLVTWKDHLDASYLREQSWPHDLWQQRYAGHGTLAILARQLIWVAQRGETATSVLPVADGCIDQRGNEVDCTSATMRLWHPLDSKDDEIREWREVLMSRGVVQPFRQVWRETFTLTDAEKATGTYSNRFAGHIVQQHQLLALGVANGWQSTHRTGFDTPNDEPTHIRIPAFGLQAEFWTQAAGADSPTSQSGSYYYLATDRVKFHRLDEKARHGRGKEVPLTSVPARVFSEIMRHCDLFTSVSSISLDPEWMDPGADAEHPSQWRQDANEYWAASHSARLQGSSATRYDMLNLLLPRLKEAERYSLQKNHLRVKGQRHSYLIHLGSAAVHIESSGRHVCIIPAGRAKAVALPFDSDLTLSLILSKAFLLANDHAINDPVILAQLND